MAEEKRGDARDRDGVSMLRALAFTLCDSLNMHFSHPEFMRDSHCCVCPETLKSAATRRRSGL